MLSGFKKFILRGNVVDMAVGVVIGAAFGGVVTELTKAFLTPLIALIVGKPDYSSLKFTVRTTTFPRRMNFLNPDSMRVVLLKSKCRQCKTGWAGGQGGVRFWLARRGQLSGRSFASPEERLRSG